MAVEWIEVMSLIAFLGGFYYILLAYRAEERLDMLLAYSAILIGILYDVFENLSTGFFDFYYSVFLKHYIGIMGAGILFALSAYFAHKRMEAVK